MIGRQSVSMTPKEEKRTRSMAANAPALATAAINPGTGDGAPRYTTGVHMWKGTPPTLKAKTTISRASPGNSRPLVRTAFLDRKSEILVRFVEPVAPFVSAAP